MVKKRKHQNQDDEENSKRFAEEKRDNDMEYEDDSSESESDSSVKSGGAEGKKKRAKPVKIPPIVITAKITNPNDYIKNIREILQMPKLRLQLGRDRLTIFPDKVEEYEAAAKNLQKAGIEHYAHPMDKVKQKHLVLKGLHNIPTTEIASNLQSQGVNPERIVIMKQKTPPPYYSPMYMVTFKSDVSLNEVRKIKFVCLMKIRWEKYKNSRKITQCYRCQDFGHGTRGCARTPKCVKCAGEHLSAECKKQPQEEPKCVNCNGVHPANYSQCPTYVKKVELLEARKKNKEI